MRQITNRHLLSFIIFLINLSVSSTAYSVEIVRLNIEYDDAAHTLDLELFDVTPLTTANFLNYVNTGKYENSFVTRSINGFIIQAGGYTFRPVSPVTNFLHPSDTPPIFVPLEATSPVKNEYDLTTLTNIRGTVAMAKLSHNPDSASNEWFINLGDNRSNLDNQNAGFTVFGRVIDNGMTIADEISNLPLQGFAGDILGAAFSALPVGTNYNLGTEPKVFQNNLVMITSANSGIVRPILRATPDSDSFPLDVAGDLTGSLRTFIFTNTGNQDLTINSISSPSLPDFIIETNTCNGVSLTAGSASSSCTMSARFIASAESVFNDSVDINYSFASNNYTLTLNLDAEGAPSTALADANKSIAVDCIRDDVGDIVQKDICFEATDQSDSSNEILVLKNKGGAALTIGTITLDNTDFTSDTSGCADGTVLNLNETCELTLSFSPTSVGNLEATLNITTSGGDLSRTLGGSGVDPEITVPASVDMGATPLDKPVTKLITVENSGTVGLLLTTFVLTGTDANDFTYTTDCPDAFMGTGASCTIVVTFTPTSNGSKTASLTINSNDAISPQKIILLSGDSIDLDVSDADFNDCIRDDTGSIIQVNVCFPATDQTGSNSRDLTFTNTGSSDLTINSISIDNTDFTFDYSSCTAGLVLAAGTNCTLSLTFTPSGIGDMSANLEIVTSDGDVNRTLGGSGVDPEITAPASVYVGSTSPGVAVNKSISIENSGAIGLLLSAINITGTDADAFSYATNCPNAFMASGESCFIIVTFNPAEDGLKSATLVIDSNDAVNPQLTIELTGDTLDSDNDGIPNSIEDKAANNGDGNNDDIADKTQNNVASFTTGSGGKTTIIANTIDVISDSGAVTKELTRLKNVTALALLPAEFPRDEFFALGGYGFDVQLTLATVGANVSVGIFLPLDVEVEKFYRFGPTPDNPEPHVYDFSFDSETGLGAIVLGSVTVKSDSGDSIAANMVLITYVDGGFGDDDLTINGQIVNAASGFSTTKPADDSSSSGAFALETLLAIFLSLLCLRSIKRYQR